MTHPAPVDSTRWIAVSAGAAFAAYYSFYVAAPVIFAGATPSAGVRVAIFMLVVVVAAQPVVLIAGRWMRNRRAIAIATLAAMALGAAGLPLAGHWPGPLLLAAGFGLFVVTSTAWVKENTSPERLGRALGSYGFGSSFGGAFGAPAGLLAAARFGMTGVALTGAGLALLAIAAAIIARSRTEPATASSPATTASGADESEVLAVCLDGGTVPHHGPGAVAATPAATSSR
ncbi:MFS transporter [Brevibacterium luteolum]|uniref:MFS transporter n=1 Tax=Brevibacterium luteolum TaxID=199591 RepID=A0A6G8KXD0_9MICO|nr:MFS transporter [Brevibacterium luteolum]QIN29283.1 MFS transporter [Brevibacterium luteolum]